MKPKKIVFCIPGSNYSIRFMRCWTDLVKELEKSEYDWDCTFHYNPEVHMTRNQILGGMAKSRKDIIPWKGIREYDYIMWIDSDIIFKPEDVFKLLKHDKDIVSGLYYVLQGPTINDCPYRFACGTLENNNLTLKDIKDFNKLIEVKGNGMGFMLIKKGVFEKIEFPWFEPTSFEYRGSGEDLIAFYSEDLSFQIKARDQGFISYVDPNVIVGHEKLVILQ